MHYQWWSKSGPAAEMFAHKWEKLTLLTTNDYLKQAEWNHNLKLQKYWRPCKQNKANVIATMQKIVQNW